MNVAVSPRAYAQYTAVQMVWDDEMVRRLVELRAEKKSFSACAAVLGVTRNAAIGIANRQRQRGNASFPLCDPNGERKGKGKRKPRVTSATAELRPRPRLVIDRRVSDLPLFSPLVRYLAFGPVTKGLGITVVGARECRYIAGSDRLCCGHETEPGSPWCTYHARLIYSPKKRQNLHARQPQ